MSIFAYFISWCHPLRYLHRTARNANLTYLIVMYNSRPYRLSIRGSYAVVFVCRYEGEWRDDRMHGRGTLRKIEGGEYKGQFFNGMRHGIGELGGRDWWAAVRPRGSLLHPFIPLFIHTLLCLRLLPIYPHPLSLIACNLSANDVLQCRTCCASHRFARPQFCVRPIK